MTITEDMYVQGTQIWCKQQSQKETKNCQHLCGKHRSTMFSATCCICRRYGVIPSWKILGLGAMAGAYLSTANDCPFQQQQHAMLCQKVLTMRLQQKYLEIATSLLTTPCLGV